DIYRHHRLQPVENSGCAGARFAAVGVRAGGGAAMNTQNWQRSLWISWLGVIAVIVIWQLVNVFEIVNPRVFPGPVEILDTALTRFPLEELAGHIFASLRRVFLGFLLGAGLGIVLGILSGWY